MFSTLIICLLSLTTVYTQNVGDFRCNGAQVERYLDTEWTLLGTCPEQTVCDPATFTCNWDYSLSSILTTYTSSITANYPTRRKKTSTKKQTMHTTTETSSPSETKTESSPSQNSQTPVPQVPNGNKVSGKATFYGPYHPTTGSELVCADAYGKDGNYAACNNAPLPDPRFVELLSFGTYDLPSYCTDRVWPKKPTVAVYAGAFSKSDICYKDITIINPQNGLSVQAAVIDLCPVGSCNWVNPSSGSYSDTPGHNVDIYGEKTLQILGFDVANGVYDVEIIWPN